jgi:hypothetical protein
MDEVVDPKGKNIFMTTIQLTDSHPREVETRNLK